MIRQGGLEGFQTDIDIPLKYGIDQCVGDTIGAGGIMYGPAGIAATARFLQGYPGGRKARRALPQLLQSYGDAHLGCNKYGGVKNGRAMPRRPGRSAPDRGLHHALARSED